MARGVLSGGEDVAFVVGALCVDEEDDDVAV
jgi:hypothetical protein